MCLPSSSGLPGASAFQNGIFPGCPGAGDTITPTYLNLFVFWLFEIPLAYVLAYHFELGPTGVFLSITIAFSVLAIVSALLFRRGKWKTKVV